MSSSTNIDSSPTNLKFYFQDYELSASSCPGKFNLNVGLSNVTIPKEKINSIIFIFLETIQQIQFPITQYVSEVRINFHDWTKETTEIRYQNPLYGKKETITLYMNPISFLFAITNIRSIGLTFEGLDEASKEINKQLQVLSQSSQSVKDFDFSSVVEKWHQVYNKQKGSFSSTLLYLLYLRCSPSLFMSKERLKFIFAHELSHLKTTIRAYFLFSKYMINFAWIMQVFTLVFLPVYSSYAAYLNIKLGLIITKLSVIPSIKVLIRIFVAMLIFEAIKLLGFSFLRKAEQQADAGTLVNQNIKKAGIEFFKHEWAFNTFMDKICPPSLFTKIKREFLSYYFTHPTCKQRYYYLSNS